MRRTQGLAAVLLLLLGTAAGHAQTASGGGSKRARSIITVFGPISYSIGPYASPYGLSYRRVTVYYYAPAPAESTPTTNANAPPPPEREDAGDKLIIRPGPRKPPEQAPPAKPEPAPEEAVKPLPGMPAGVFRPVRPEDRARALQPMLPEPPQPPPAPDKPVSEQARLITLAKAAFAAGEYGLAERRFRQATTTAPDEALASFLLAQAQIAQGKYQEAVASIHQGLRRQPDWPDVPFRPRDLYGPEAADFPDHVKQLRETLSRHPEDPVLLFLLAYQLWFDGQRAEARKLFERAAAVTPDRTFIDRFLQ